MTTVGDTIVAELSESGFRSAIRQAVRGLWNGVFDLEQFFDAMLVALERGFREAWIEGAAECGIAADEITAQERSILFGKLADNTPFIIPFGKDVIKGSKANGGKLQLQLQRAELWINRYNDVRNLAKSTACADRKQKWVLGATEEHCKTCARLNGKVKRGSQWKAAGLQPQNAPNPKLECEGWRCDCRFEITNEPMSKGTLPKVP